MVPYHALHPIFIDNHLGMMDGAYFVGRKELLDFFNNLLDLNYTKIEQTASGALACQITSLIFPQSIPMSRVNWDAKADFEFVANYKLLQNAFNKHKVQRYVDVDKLIRAKYQDNLEFCQWLKAFYEQSGAVRPDDYDPSAVRARGKGGARFNQQFGRRNRGGAAPAAARKPRAAPVVSSTTSRGSPRASRPLRDRDNTTTSTTTKSSTTAKPKPADAKPGPTQQQMDALQTKNNELMDRVQELEQSLVALEEERDMAILDLEKERDFYFTKLRDVEVMLQIHDERDSGIPKLVLEELFKVLYATAEENIAINEEGFVVESEPEAAASDSFQAEHAVEA